MVQIFQELQVQNYGKNNKTGVKGVSKTKKGTYVACIGFRYQNIYLGEYRDIEKAIKVRKEAEEKYFKPVLDKYKDKS